MYGIKTTNVLIVIHPSIHPSIHLSIYPSIYALPTPAAAAAATTTALLIKSHDMYILLIGYTSNELQ